MDAEADEATEAGSFWVGPVFLIARGILGWFGMYCIHRLHYGRLVGGFPSEETLDRIGLLWFSRRNWLFMRWLVQWEKLASYWMDGADRLDETRVGHGWYGGTNIRRRRGSATIFYLGAAGDWKRWLPPIASVLQGRGLFVSEKQNNPNRLHTNPNWNVVKDSINNTYNTTVLWLYTNPEPLM